VFANKGTKEPTPTTPNTTAQQQGTTTKDASTTETDATETPVTQTATTPKADPATLSSIDITPLGVSVFYTKGIPGFEYTAKRTADQTQYVELTSPDLIGTKCTDDTGLIVSIIKNPSSTEDQATLSQTVKVGNDSYGLSLAGKGCTGDAELLDKYQAAFTNGFPSLKAL